MSHNPIAITDLEATGLDCNVHEILEIGLVITDETLTIHETFSVKIKPEHIETADPTSLKINGYSPEEWNDAVPLHEAITRYEKILKNAKFCSHNPTVDWGFLRLAFKKTGIMPTPDYTTNYHRIDVFSLAWHALKDNPPNSFRLRDIASHLGIAPEPEPHRALNGALLAFEVYKKLMSPSHNS